MKNLIEKIEPFSHNCLNVVVETPRRSQVKYAYDPDSGLFRLKMALPDGMAFPFNFGFVPSTLGEDGDPLDVLVLNQEALAVGCLLSVRLMGVIQAEQRDDKQWVRNDRLLGMAISKETLTSMKTTKVTKQTCAEIEHFFVSYNRLRGREIRILGYKGRKTALAVVRQGAERFRKDAE